MPAGASVGVQYALGETMPSCSDFVMPGCMPYDTTAHP